MMMMMMMTMQRAGRCHIQRDSPESSRKADSTEMFLMLWIVLCSCVYACRPKPSPLTTRNIASNYSV